MTSSTSNSAMVRALQQAGMGAESARPPLEPALRDILNQGFFSFDGCVFLERFRQIAERYSVQDFPDRTGFECFVNHIHVEDFLPKISDIRDQLTQALSLAHDLSAALCKGSPAQSFSIIMNSGDDGAIVRFHVKREGERYVAASLEKYDEPVLVIEEAASAC